MLVQGAALFAFRTKQRTSAQVACIREYVEMCPLLSVDLLFEQVKGAGQRISVSAVHPTVRTVIAHEPDIAQPPPMAVLADNQCKTPALSVYAQR